jgi:hypothetical protein
MGLSSLHDKYVIVPADKASNNIVFVCKSYYFECLIKELREERPITASWSLNIDLGRLLTQFLSLGIRPCTRDLIVLTQSDKDSNSGSTSSNTTYKPTSFDKDEILANHRKFMTSLNIPSGKESEDLPYLYWIPKLHKTPYKERYIEGSSTCSTKELSIHLTKIMSAVKEGQQKYCEAVYSRSGINHKGDKYVIDEELQHTDHLFLGVACFTFLNFV